MAVTKAVIPAAGKGTRLYPASKAIPKELFPLGTKPVIQLAVEELAAAGIEEVLVVTRGGKQAIDAHFALDSDWQQVMKERRGTSIHPEDLRLWDLEVQLFFTWQAIPLGSGDAISKARAFCGDQPFVVALGDCYIHKLGAGPTLLQRMIEAFEANEAAACIATYQVPWELTAKYGVLAPAGEISDPTRPFLLEDIVEKPGPEDAPSNWAVSARYVFSPRIFEEIEAERADVTEGKEVELTNAIRRLVRSGRPVYAVPLMPDEFRLDVGGFASFGPAFVRMLSEHEQFGRAFREYLVKLVNYLQGKGPDPDAWGTAIDHRQEED